MKNIRKTVLITGGSRGRGRGVALELARRQYSVAIVYNGNSKAADETKVLCQQLAEEKDTRGRFETFQCDIANSFDRDNLLDKVLASFGRIDGLVNSAGVAPKERRDLLDMTEESFDRLIQINLKGSFFLSKQLSNYWLTTPSEQERHIIFIGSVSSEMVSLNRGEYCMAKSALSMGAALLAKRLAANGILVYEIRPGIIKTDMTLAVQDKYDQEIIDGLVPQRRWGTPQDIALATATLLDGEFPFSTGSVIHIDGGLHIQEL